MDAVDRCIVNTLQRGFPIVAEPYATVAEDLGISETQLLERLQKLLEGGVLTRFGPMYHAERLGGALTLAAMAVADDDFERVSNCINRLPEVAHNYAREHELNMWFVLATETPEEIGSVIQQIENDTGYPVYNLPKVDEFFVGLHLTV